LTLTIQANRTSSLNILEFKKRPQVAFIYCEGNFKCLDGKTAHGLLRQSDEFEIKAVIDSESAGLDSGMVLNGIKNGIPIVENLTAAINLKGCKASNFIYGMAPANGLYSNRDRSVILDALSAGLNVISGMREFLSDEAEFALMAASHNAIIQDVRRPPELKNLRLFNGSINTVNCIRIAILGTDGAIGKRTTATLMVKALNQKGISTVLISTGQTGLIQGGRYGVALDAIPSQFCSGEVEAAVVKAYNAEKPKVIIIEGQGALSHPAYLSSGFILRGSKPHAVVLQHAPKRKNLSDFPFLAMPTPGSEIKLIEAFEETKVIGITINHEEMNDNEVNLIISSYEVEYNIPVTDAVSRAPETLVAMVLKAFPELQDCLNNNF
jgi:hypothetical protein